MLTINNITPVSIASQDTVLPDNLKEDVEKDVTVEPLPTSVDLLLGEQAATDKAGDEEVSMAFGPIGPIKPSPSVIKTETNTLLLGPNPSM